MVTIGSPDCGFTAPLYVWNKCHYYQGFRNRAPIFNVGLPPTATVTSYTNPVKIAVQYKEMLDIGLVGSQAELASLLGVSRAKVTQMLNLLKLDDEIQEFMVGLEETDERLRVLTERRLRPLVGLDDRGAQKEEFEKIL